MHDSTDMSYLKFKLIETQSGMVVARGWKEGERTVVVQWVQSFSVAMRETSRNVSHDMNILLNILYIIEL